MKAHVHVKCQIDGAAAAALRLALTVVLSVFVLLGQVFPASASHGTSDSGAWVEICSDGGTYLAQLDQGEDEQSPECTHCSFCIVPSGEVPVLHTQAHGTLEPIEFTLISYSVDRSELPETPEQYWSACRGPPIVSVENNMTPTTSLTIKEPIGSAFEAWSVPCV
jgi:hypothetical protein